MTRGSVGRRALHVALLVGGLFVLGLLWGKQASAAEGVAAGSNHRAATVEVQRVLRPVTEQVPRPVTGQILRPVTEQAVRPVTDVVVPSAAGHVVRPVGRPIGDLVDQITGGIAGQPAPPQGWPTLPHLPPLPDVPVPGFPEAPGLPLPEVPGVPEMPGQTPPAGTGAPQRPDGPTDGDQAAGQTAEKQAVEEQVPGKSREENGAPAAFGPRFAGGFAAADSGARLRAHPRHVTASGVAPVHQVPDSDPAGVSGGHSAADSGSPRHGDAQAVTSSERLRSALVPGAAEDVTAAGTRDRHRDIPASPG
ncbi:hypothetical protein ACFYXC_11055 [Streptomyces sp. NPDC002701]|uniref:hypothetical protein n=1 Tax=Streptomyces sp. NPDC002701 TaxID=3364661 RepID=UPI00368433E3